MQQFSLLRIVFFFLLKSYNVLIKEKEKKKGSTYARISMYLDERFISIRRIPMFQREYTRMRCLLTQYAESRICVTMEYVGPRRYESLILHIRMPNCFRPARVRIGTENRI